MRPEEELAIQQKACKAQANEARVRIAKLEEELNDLYAFRTQHTDVSDQASFEILHHQQCFDELRSTSNGLSFVLQMREALNEALYGSDIKQIMAQKEQEKDEINKAIQMREQEIEENQQLIAALVNKQEQCSKMIEQIRRNNERNNSK